MIVGDAAFGYRPVSDVEHRPIIERVDEVADVQIRHVASVHEHGLARSGALILSSDANGPNLVRLLMGCRRLTSPRMKKSCQEVFCLVERGCITMLK